MILTEFIVEMIKLKDEGHGNLQVYLGHHHFKVCDQIYTQTTEHEEWYRGMCHKKYLRLEGEDA